MVYKKSIDKNDARFFVVSCHFLPYGTDTSKWRMSPAPHFYPWLASRLRFFTRLWKPSFWLPYSPAPASSFPDAAVWCAHGWKQTSTVKRRRTWTMDAVAVGFVWPCLFATWLPTAPLSSVFCRGRVVNSLSMPFPPVDSAKVNAIEHCCFNN